MKNAYEVYKGPRGKVEMSPEPVQGWVPIDGPGWAFEPKVHDQVRGKGNNLFGNVVGTVMGIRQINAGEPGFVAPEGSNWTSRLVLCIAVQRPVPQPVAGGILKQVGFYCENPGDAKVPVAMIETVTEYGYADNFELILRDAQPLFVPGYDKAEP